MVLSHRTLTIGCFLMSEEMYYLYFDDSGIRFPDKQQKPVRNDGLDHFALGGILLKKADRSDIIEGYKELRKKWRITYPLRSSDMRGKRGNFIWLTDKPTHDAFFEDLNTYLCNIPVIGFAAVVDRIGYNNRYEAKYGDKRWWMCKTAFSILVERAAKHVSSNDGHLKLRFEEAGKKEDRAIMEYTKDLKTSGMPFDPTNSSKYDFLKTEGFRRILLGEPERQSKKSPLLQIADLFLYPIVKGGYDKAYPPYRILMENNKLIDALLQPEKVGTCGIKYSCFDSR